MLVIGGLLLSFVPGIPKVELSPDLVFFVILPPLLYSAAWLTSWREFSYNLVSIFLLAFGLVSLYGGWRYPSGTVLSGFRLGELEWCSVRLSRLPDAIAETSIRNASDSHGKWLTFWRGRAC